MPLSSSSSSTHNILTIMDCIGALVVRIKLILQKKIISMQHNRNKMSRTSASLPIHLWRNQKLTRTEYRVMIRDINVSADIRKQTQKPNRTAMPMYDLRRYLKATRTTELHCSKRCNIQQLTSLSDVPHIPHDLHSIHCHGYFFTEIIIFGVNWRQLGCPVDRFRNNTYTFNAY